MSLSDDLVVGVAELLDAAGIGVWDLAGGYAETDVAIVKRAFNQTPDRQIALATYDVDNDPALPMSIKGLQVRVRGTKDPTVADDIDDAVFDELHGLTHSHLTTGVVIHQCLRNSGVSLGPDGNGRFERTTNYYIDVHYPTTHRPTG